MTNFIKAGYGIIAALLKGMPSTLNMGLTFASSAYSNVVCWLSSLTFCPDVHCPVTVNKEAVSDYGALFTA